MKQHQESAQERRRHIVYFTDHSEYHCRDRECVGVRDRRTRRWQRYHPAVRLTLLGGMRGDHKMYRRLAVGSRLVFHGGRTVLTSNLSCAARPPREALFYYSSLCKSGEIHRAA